MHYIVIVNSIDAPLLSTYTPDTMKNQLYTIIIAALLTLTLGCDSNFYGSKPDIRPDATKILRITVEPNPVIQGQTATFTCVIKDSLKDGFSYLWRFPEYSEQFQTESNILSWPVTLPKGEVVVRVTVSTTTRETERVSMYKEFTIITSN